ncbi:MAG: cation transporter [Bacteroidetes bacterium]|nr:cation transporter [Bacteroidota bacterium]MBT6687214.1 cation transporter [Bacteroidota bacterium]MBT7144579.1 cation transporter [Bacteroidota bacterium]MBT7490779.1 cation transporter [Bacteroidota bacterium]
MLSIVTNLFLFILKYWAGIISGSLAIIADAWHTLSDSLSSIILLFGNKISSKPPDKNHPFGHGRAELIAAIIIGLFIAIIGFNFIIESFHKLKENESANYGIIAVVVILISVIAKEALARYAFWAGKKVNSKSLVADGWHHRSDALSSVVLLVGIFLNRFFWWIDGVLGILIALFLFHATYKILKDAIDTLLGQKPDDKLIKSINELSEQIYPHDMEIHHFHIHSYGNHHEITFHMRLPKDMKLEEVHSISSGFVKLIKEKLGIFATIYVDPIENT